MSLFGLREKMLGLSRGVMAAASMTDSKVPASARLSATGQMFVRMSPATAKASMSGLP
jgi:hypothetical protein